MSNGTPHVTVEQTRKTIKLQQAIATLVLILGGVLLICSFQAAGEQSTRLTRNGWLTLAGGAVWSLGMRLAAWWHHG